MTCAPGSARWNAQPSFGSALGVSRDGRRHPEMGLARQQKFWVAYASRVLLAVSHRNRLFPIRAWQKECDGGDAVANTREACATPEIEPTLVLSLCFLLREAREEP